MRIWVLLFLFLAQGALAKTKKHEVYSAIDGSPEEAPEFLGRKNVQVTSEQSAGTQDKDRGRSVSVMVAKKTDAAEASCKAEYKTISRDFDVVPQGHQDSIAGRLQIVEKLVLEYGRAYDYRAFTTDELSKILFDLDAERSAKSD